MSEEGASQSKIGGAPTPNRGGSTGATKNNNDVANELLLTQVTVGTKIAVHWQAEKKYYPGVVAAHHPNDWQAHVYTINYDDGDVETIDLAIERFRVLGGKMKRSSDGSADDDGGGTETKATSLIVRFDQCKETWRSPPTYCGSGDDQDESDFIWPDGWIEVQRLKESEREEGVDNQQQLLREFHPPYPAGYRGRTKICYSITEVKRYIDLQKAKRLKQERLDRQSPSRPRRQSKTNPNRASSRSTGAPMVYPPGTQTELNKIMRGKTKASSRMRQSILLGAVLAHKRGTVEAGSDAGFIGADGRMYADLRKAFGKHVPIKQCALCKARVQGHWFCRIAHGHLDKPDYDGGNTASECLLDLFRCTIEELDERLQELLSGGPVMNNGRKKTKVELEGFRTAEWSMNRLSEDLLYQIASFLPNLSQLTSFCKTSKRGQHLLYESVHSEKLFQGVFLRAFGEEGTKGNFERNLSWRERWSMIRDLRRGLVQKCIRPPTAVMHRLRDTIGVLPHNDERDAIYYDNPECANEAGGDCNGYFGMEILHLPPPPNARPGWEPPIIIRGDFNGVRIFNSVLGSLFHDDSARVDGEERLNQSVAIGNDVGGGQVLSLIQFDTKSASLLKDSGEGYRPCCFIGYASGRVAAVAATLTEEGDGYTFSISGTHHAHESEVTDLTYVNCGSSPEEELPVLFSACCAGKVYFYPNALNPAQNFSMEQSVLAFSNFYDCPIFSMASTVIHSQGQSLSLLCTGDRDGNIRLWLKPDDDLLGMCTRRDQQKFRHIKMFNSSTQRGTGYHLVTKAMFVNTNLLITGTNNGDVRFWQLQCTDDPDKGPLPNLTLRYDMMGIHNGAVELLMNVGDILLSSGGNEGTIVGWDISTGLRLGSIRCHPGRALDGVSGNVCSCVVDLLMSGKDGSLISLCRDGSLKQFKMM
eukprot:CAMPEP_0183714366 /NCGR_PEP_ID=MMETSP0737-20130205/8898_1 /TAXON_ID=385413 /ORGANISM="Thalassiosira miniscula, Strain CCMP1093" /LENGTH=926 /DNA_ID=CAMNT_0025943275 /DNA_START=152 /DNA_END=2932 /DNA_ORIENTATION=+